MNYEHKMTEALDGIVDIQRHMIGIGQQRETLGKRILESEEMKRFIGGADQVRIPITPMEVKTAIIGSGSQNDALANTARPPIAEGARRRLFLRDLMSPGETDQGAIEYPTETGSTNNAGSQNGQNTSFSESGYTFGLTHEPCETIGHFVHVSKQVLQDSGVLTVFLQSSLIYGLRLEEERQMIAGTGTNGELNGILGQATTYSQQSPGLTNEIDILRDAITQLQLADYTPQAILLNPTDWQSIDVRKVGSSNDSYAAGSPRDMTEPRLWGLPVLPSNSIASGTFLVGDFARGAALFDRQEAAIEFSRHHGDNWTKGLVTILADERAGFVVTNAGALVTGSL